MKKKLFVFLTVFSILLFAAVAQTEETGSQPDSIPSTTQLLLSYMENDPDLKNLLISAKKAALSYDSTKIDNGFDITLSSGTVTLLLGDDGTSVSAKPSAKAKLPAFSNLSASVQTNVSYTSNEANVSDTALSLGIDLISDSNIKTKVTLLKAERSVTEAERKLGKSGLATEKEFYTELKSLLSSISSIMNLENDYYTDRIDFEAKKIQGYSKTSSTYRKAELKVISDQHEIESSLHSFIHDCVVFYKKCGYDIQIDENTDLMTLVPSDIELSEPLNILDFSKEDYAAIESANWTYKINSLERSGQKSYSLSASAGYTLGNSKTNSDTVDAGLSGTVGGVSVGAGLSMPVGTDSFTPAVTLSVSLSPNTFKKNSITKQQNALTEEQELLAIQTAEAEYETTVVEMQQKLDSLLWDKNSIEQNLSMYEELEKDMASMYKQGFTSESEYLSAKTDLNTYILKKVINQIELLTYNDDVIMNFVPTQEK